MKVGDIFNFKTGQVQITEVDLIDSSFSECTYFRAKIISIENATLSGWQKFESGTEWYFYADGKFNRSDTSYEHTLDLNMNPNRLYCKCELCT